MDFTDKQIDPPKTWQKFEDICHDVFKHVWRDPLAKKNGRTGQAQHGVDVYGSPDSRGHGYHGVQCKGKDRAYGDPPTIKEVKDELTKTEKFDPRLEHWTFATTAAKDARLEQEVRILSQHPASAAQLPARPGRP